MTTRRRIRSWAAYLAVSATAIALLVGLPATVAPTETAEAAVGSDFNAGNIINDAVFYDSSALTAAQVQDFLNRQVSRCSSGYTCLKDYRQNTDNRPSDRYCNGYTGRANESAAQIIDSVARSCGISQKVLLVLLQKEQSLVTSTAPSAWNYSAATGQGCPDTAPCDAATSGFFYQVYYAARQYEIYRLTASSWGYQAGRWNNILYHPEANRGCGSARVYIENQATAGLYIYTPYTPNAAALRNLYGTGDNCSSYGNRNFWRLFTDWFGSTQVSDSARSPFGGFNLVVERGLFTVQGWALDPDSPSAQLTVSLTVDGAQNWASFTANSYRPDVGAAYPGYGDNHGMNSSHEILGGDHTVCVSVRNVGAGGDRDFGCSTISVVTASPQGGTSVEVLPGGIRLTGWTIDTDTVDPLAVHVYVDDKASAHIANTFRPDVGSVFPGFGDYHGIDISMPLGVGQHRVCAYGINVGRGFNNLLGCHDVAITSASPFGDLNEVTAVPGGVRVRGWAIDPETTDPLAVHVYRGSSPTAINASDERPDVAAAYPKSGSRHGFNSFIAAPRGRVDVCAYGINVGWGENALLGCKTTTVMGGDPFGGIDASLQDGRVRLRGWAIDPDTVDPIPVHVYIDGKPSATVANSARPDVGAVYPGYGGQHGIDESYDLAPGAHTICAYGINTGAGVNALLACSNIDVPNHEPFGGTDITRDGQGVILRGWTIDPDTAGPIDVHVYVDGAPAVVAKADVNRPDVARVYPAFGALHGIEVRIPLLPGTRRVCTYAINQGPGSANPLLGCQSITI